MKKGPLAFHTLACHCSGLFISLQMHYRPVMVVLPRLGEEIKAEESRISQTFILLGFPTHSIH